jgi:hypothetical protein
VVHASRSRLYLRVSPWSPHLSLEFDYASGDGRGAKFGRFDTLFGMRRSDLAPAGLYNAVGRTNLLAPGVRLEVVATKKLDGFVAYRPLWLASRSTASPPPGCAMRQAVRGALPAISSKRNCATGLIPKRLRLEWNGLYLAKGRFLQEAPNAPAGGDTFYNSFNATISL